MQKVPFQLVKQLRERVPSKSLQQCKEALGKSGHDLAAAERRFLGRGPAR